MRGPSQVIRTRRLVIRPVVQRDGRALERVLADAEVMRFSATGPLSRAEVRDWMAVARGPAQPGCGRLVLCLGGDVIGYAGLRADGPRKGEFGIRLARREWGRGLAREAGAAILARAERAGISTIRAEVDPGNAASRRLLARLGFVEMGEVLHPGYDHPDLVLIRRRQRPTKAHSVRYKAAHLR
ncbi:MAG: GNAT family N-acetyltransferase [Pseudomonadota bacterium]